LEQNNIDVISGRDQVAASSSDLIDRLSRLGVADGQLRQCYVDGLSHGGTLVTARAPDERKADEAAKLMRQHGASNCASSTAAEGQGVARLPVVEEELKVGKREVQTGGVRVRQQVTERPVEEQVNLREEHVKVERRPVDRPIGDADHAFQERTIEATETAEEAVVAKEARVVEEVVVNKEVEQRTQNVRDTVRRTDVKVEAIEPDNKRRPK
jgi:uncharacterized protein (TIGR02271 family)